MYSKSFYLFLICGLLLIAISQVSAQTQGLHLENFYSGIDRNGYIKLQSSHIETKGTFNITRWNTYSKNMSILDSPRSKQKVPHRVSDDLIVQRSMTDDLAFAFSTDSVVYQNIQTQTDGKAESRPWGAVGDLKLIARYQLIKLSNPHQKKPQHPFGLGVLFGIGIPTGNAFALAGEGTPHTTTQIISDIQFWKFVLGLTLGWKHRFTERYLGSTLIHDELHYGLGIKTRFLPWTLLLELRGVSRLGQGWDKYISPHSLETDAGLSVQIEYVDLIGTFGTNFIGTIGKHALRAQLGFIITVERKKTKSKN